MKQEDWMPLYIGSYLADTPELNTLQHGAYFLLIMAYWKNGPLPPNHKRLAAIARTDISTWLKEIWPALSEFFKHEDGMLRQNRLDIERALRGTKKRTPPVAEIVAPKQKHAKAIRLPDDWKPDGGYAAFARSGGLNPAHVGARFLDYWRGVGGEKGCKADWPATWRNWCRRDANWKEPDKAAAQATVPVAASTAPAKGCWSQVLGRYMTEAEMRECGT
jgi:uncharacterized protein YdaU (DUF1376 family)